MPKSRCMSASAGGRLSTRVCVDESQTLPFEAIKHEQERLRRCAEICSEPDI